MKWSNCRKIRLILIVFMAAIMLSSGSAKADLVAYYPLDGDTLDASGNGWDGSEEGGTVTYVEGKHGMAASFDGSVYISTEATATLLNIDGAKPKTIMAWYKRPEGYDTTNTGVWSIGDNNTDQEFPMRIMNSSAGAYRVAQWNAATAINFEEFSTDWIHLAASYDGSTITAYCNGEVVGTSFNDALATSDRIPFRIARWWNTNAEGSIDDVQVYDNCLTQSEIKVAMADISKGQASKPNPEDEAIEVSIDADLSWKSGKFARTHDVYFSTVMEDANDAEVDTPLDALLQAGHDVNNYDLDRLDYGQDYYWRIDEVNGAPDYSIYRGELWNFTTELLAYPIDDDKIIVTASSSATDQEAENTINGSGIDPNTNQHTNYSEDMWLSEAGDATPWIQYEFDTVYKLNRMLVWNYNGEFPNNFFGASDVTVEYSADGENWETSDVTAFAQASGMATYEAGDTVEFGDVAVKYVKISIKKNQADESLVAFFSSAGLSEVLFLAVPVQARYPVPEDGAVDVNIFNPTLNWTAGRKASEHDIYLDGDLMEAGLTETSYTIPMTLELSTTYEWRVDEVNGADVWPGSAWSFTTVSE